MPTPHQQNPVLTQIALAVMVEGLIADQVLPRVPVEAELFRYRLMNVADGLTLTDTAIGRTGDAGEVQSGSSLADASTKDWGLKAVVPIKDIEQAQASGAPDPLATEVELTQQLIDLAREVRVANLVTALATYDSSQRTTLSGNSQWSDPASDPISALLAVKRSMLVKPNLLVTGEAVADALTMHPKIVAAAYPLGGNAVTGGQATLEAVAKLLGLERILVGKAQANTAKKGQTASYAPVWGKHAALLRIDPAVRSARPVVPTFGFTAEFGQTQVYRYFDPDRGVHGSEVAKIVEQLNEIICYPLAGYLFRAAVA